MLTRTAEHALRAIIFLARQPDDRPVSAETVAAALGAPANYLAKTLGALANAGILRGRRGPRGGYRLLIPANRLTIGEITELFEPEHGISGCLLGGRACDPTNPCSAHFRWVAVRDAAKEPLRTTTIADLILPANGASDRQAHPESMRFGSTDDDLLKLLCLA
jgi:Rrf2 family protein